MSKHQIKLINRELIEITGVTEVLNYSEEEVNLETELGPLFITGEGFNIKQLNLDDGELVINGHIMNLDYSENAKGGSFLNNLFK
ncbi:MULTISPECIES: sporulation protein YabP [unclassified Candidatus Frackibacter]|uniref:sporulation protein YabP n=1 Tax=unclassified Candidatus Frackibacter TaxID=2648818 RepID=UPI00088C75E3|nr:MULTISPECIES: sporulation protein YabP [unclassified Candidatus Frackibacter]SDC66706.1 sporulation protein YabP [Candidatus Frackibacter sp. WG11]SEM79911.1 sporulation protein YabP [Candidatus Frackibacter sp. WG12]SFL90559.1 sporulation protein YabP [Candidatus Frackibacter sp. WG13]